MLAPKIQNEIRGFFGRLQYISRFIAQLIDICESIFRLLRKSQLTIQDNACQKAFERIKAYLLKLSVLIPPIPGHPLLIYFFVMHIAFLGCMLTQHGNVENQQVIYYLSNKMLDYELRYVMIERMCLALVQATRRLKHYMIEYLVFLILRLDP